MCSYPPNYVTLFSSWTKSISSGAQYVTLQKYFSHPSFSYLLFFNPTHYKKQLGQQIRGGTTNSKPPGTISTIWFSSSNCTVQDRNVLSTAGDALSLNAIENTFPLIRMSNIHVWTMNCTPREQFVVLEHQH
jgi:hypothetical protein